jgi:diketogulonate reductase-like aldo/keto reductase
VRLLNGVMMPRIAFGTAGLPRGASHEGVITAAVLAGFRSFDTAQATEWYDEAAVGNALNSSGVPRSELFVTTKIHPRDMTYDRTVAALGRSADAFGGYLDLVLLHYPRCFPGVCTSAEQRRVEAAGGWKEAWRALRRAVVLKQVRSVGVSNFDVTEVATVDPPPHVVQNWFDPFRQV